MAVRYSEPYGNNSATGVCAVYLGNIDLSLRRIAEALEHPPSLRDLETKLADANIEITRLRMGQGVAK